MSGGTHSYEYSYNMKRRQERLKGMAPMEYRHYALAA
ncbi:IS3 family transposase [Glutamicibacter ardleyensis]